jgi:hypothetical protein
MLELTPDKYLSRRINNKNNENKKYPRKNKINGKADGIIKLDPCYWLGS